MPVFDRYAAREFTGPLLSGLGSFSMTSVAGGPLWRITQYISKCGATGPPVVKLLIGAPLG